MQSPIPGPQCSSFLLLCTVTHVTQNVFRSENVVHRTGEEVFVFHFLYINLKCRKHTVHVHMIYLIIHNVCVACCRSGHVIEVQKILS